MKILILCILIYVTTLCWSQDETEFHCAPKPGCQIAQCKATARGWNGPGFNIGEHLLSKEFPITCKSKNTAQSQNTRNLFSLVTRNILDIGNVRTDLKELAENFDKTLNNMKNFGKESSDISHLRKENQEQEKKIIELEKKDMEQSEKISELENEGVKQSIQINKLEEKNLKQSKQINDLEENNLKQSRQLDDLEKKNAQQLTQIDEFKKENSEQAAELVSLKKAMTRFEQKHTAMEKTQHFPTTTRQITRPTTKTQTSRKPTQSPENCELKIGNICYFAEIHNKEDVNYNRAVEICKKRNADVGLFRDEEYYTAIMNLLRQGIPWKGIGWIRIWTGIQFNPITGDVTSADSITKWYPGYPDTGSSYIDYTNVYLRVNRNPANGNQGMGNGKPSWNIHGVICEIQT